MIKNAWLIQTGEIQKPYNNYKGKKLSEAVDLEYRGSSEFEFGALPKSLRALQANKDKIQFDKVEFENEVYKGHDLSGTVRILHTFGKEEFNLYILNSLFPMFRDKLQLKERSEFGYSSVRYDGRLSKVDFWWDIENHVMWSFDKMFMKRILDHLEASWSYMDANKQQS